MSLGLDIPKLAEMAESITIGPGDDKRLEGDVDA